MPYEPQRISGHGTPAKKAAVTRRPSSSPNTFVYSETATSMVIHYLIQMRPASQLKKHPMPVPNPKTLIVTSES